MPASANVAAIARRPERERFYFRVGYNDHVVLDRLLAERKLHADGVVLDARWHQRHQGLRQHADDAMVATCLDTQAMELALPAAVSKGYADLPWAQVRSLTLADFSSRRVGQFVESIVERVVEGGYTEVLAPSHYLADAGSDWLDIDCALVGELRRNSSRRTGMPFASRIRSRFTIVCFTAPQRVLYWCALCEVSRASMQSPCVFNLSATVRVRTSCVASLKRAGICGRWKFH